MPPMHSLQHLSIWRYDAIPTNEAIKSSKPIKIKPFLTLNVDGPNLTHRSQLFLIGPHFPTLAGPPNIIKKQAHCKKYSLFY